jgi:hypothetical protein
MPGQVHRFYAIARSAASVYEAAAANQGDAVFGITVLPL